MSAESCTTKHWSSTQTGIALSPAQAELYAATRASNETKGLKSYGQDSGEILRLVPWVDAQAMFGLTFRSGLGKACHIERAEKWIQDFVERGECELRRVGGEHPPANMHTKPVSREVLDRHRTYLRCHGAQSAGHNEVVPAEGRRGELVGFISAVTIPWQAHAYRAIGGGA